MNEAYEQWWNQPGGWGDPNPYYSKDADRWRLGPIISWEGPAPKEGKPKAPEANPYMEWLMGEMQRRQAQAMDLTKRFESFWPGYRKQKEQEGRQGINDRMAQFGKQSMKSLRDRGLADMKGFHAYRGQERSDLGNKLEGMHRTNMGDLEQNLRGQLARALGDVQGGGATAQAAMNALSGEAAWSRYMNDMDNYYRDRFKWLDREYT